MESKQVQLYLDREKMIEASPVTSAECVMLTDGNNLQKVLDNDLTTPTVAHEESSFKTGVGDIDVSSSVVDGEVGRMVIKGKTYQNILPEPSTHVLTNNKEMFKVNEGLDPNVEIVDGASKSAILKGNTLVNLSENLTTITRSVKGWYIDEKLMNNIEKLKRNTYYTILYRLENLSGNHEHYNGIGLGIGITGFNKDLPGVVSTVDKNGGWCKIRFQLTDDFIEQNPTYKQLHIRPIRRFEAPVEGESVNYTIRGFAILEGDYITKPIPFNEVFEGMQSVKLPVLTTTGKNLFNPLDLIISENQHVTCVAESNKLSFRRKTGSNFNSSSYIQLEPNTKYWMTITTKSYNQNADEYVKLHLGKRPHNDSTEYGGFVIKASTDGTQYRSFTTDSDAKLYINGYVGSVGYDVWDIMLEKSDDPNASATPYEPFKSNILTVNEPIELRGIGDVKDELNLLTGEVVERTGEIVLNGNESWWFADGPDNPESTGTWTHSENTWLLGVDFTTISSNTHPVKNTISDKYPVYYNYSFSDSEYFNILSDNNALLFRVRKDRFSDKSIVNFKSWLSQNPITIQYQLTTPTVKTVDLSSSGNWEKVVLDGSEDESWGDGDNGLSKTHRFYVTIPNLLSGNHSPIIDSTYFTPIQTGTSSQDTPCVQIASNKIHFRIERQIADSLTSFKTWLQQNPLTVWYPTTTHQDSTQVKQPIFFKDGHIQLSSGADNSLIPTLDYEAKTSNSYVMDLMKPNTRYTMKAKSASGTFTIDGASYGAGTNGTFTTPTSMTNKLLVMSDTAHEEVMILEGDVTDKTIPYFKGIKSAFEDEDKIEVLSTGKNLFIPENHVSLTKHEGYWSVNKVYTNDKGIYYKLKPNTKYILSFDKYGTDSSWIGVVVNGVYRNNGNANYIYVFNTDSTGETLIQIGANTQSNVGHTICNIQLEESSSATNHEPHKSNTTKIPLLSPLRSLPNGVCDELIIDRMKKKATLIKRLDCITFDGSSDENWHSWGINNSVTHLNSYHYVDGTNNTKNLKVKANPSWFTSRLGYGGGYTSNKTGVSLNNSYFAFSIPKNLIGAGGGDTTTMCEKNARKWLSQNPVTVYYELATPVVTEIDLESFPLVYKDGHIFLNSEIAPVVEIDYNVNQAQLIIGNGETLLRHEQEILDLDKLIVSFVDCEYRLRLLKFDMELSMMALAE